MNVEINDPARITKDGDRYEIKQKAKETMQEKNLDFNFADESLSDIAGKLKIEKHPDTDWNWLMITMGDGTTEDDIIYFIDNPTGRKIATQFLVDLALETRDFKNTINDATAKETLKTFLRSIDSTETNIDIAEVDNMDITNQSKKEIQEDNKNMKEEKKETNQENNQKEKANKTEAELLHERVEQALLAMNDMELYLLIAQAENITATANASKQALKSGNIDPWWTEISTLQLDGRVKSFYVLAGLITKFEEFESQNKWNSDVKLKMQSEIYELAKSMWIAVDRDLDIWVKDVVFPRKWPHLTCTIIKKALFKDAQRGKTVEKVVKIYAAERSTEIDIPTALGMTQAIIRGDAPYQKNLTVKQMLKEYNKSGKVIDKKYNLRYLAWPDGKQTVVREQKSPDGKIVYTNLDGTPFTRAVDLDPFERNEQSIIDAQYENNGNKKEWIRAEIVKTGTGNDYRLEQNLNVIGDRLLFEEYHKIRASVKATTTASWKWSGNAENLWVYEHAIMKRFAKNPSEFNNYMHFLSGSLAPTVSQEWWDIFWEIMGNTLFTADVIVNIRADYQKYKTIRTQWGQLPQYIMASATERQDSDDRLKVAVTKHHLKTKYARIMGDAVDNFQNPWSQWAFDQFLGTLTHNEHNRILDTAMEKYLKDIEKPMSLGELVTSQRREWLRNFAVQAAYAKDPKLWAFVKWATNVIETWLNIAETAGYVVSGLNLLKAWWHTITGTRDLIFKKDAKISEVYKAVWDDLLEAGKRGLIGWGIWLTSSKEKPLIQRWKDLLGTLGMNDERKANAERRKKINNPLVDVQSGNAARSTLELWTSGISINELMENNIVTQDGDKVKFDASLLVKTYPQSGFLQWLSQEKRNEKYLGEFSKDVESMLNRSTWFRLSRPMLEEIAKNEAGVTLPDLIKRAESRTDLIWTTLANSLDKTILTQEQENRLYFLSEKDRGKKKEHLAFCCQQMDKLNKPSLLVDYQSKKAWSNFIINGTDTNLMMALPKTIIDSGGISGYKYITTIMKQIVEAKPDDTTLVNTLVKNYLKTLSTIYRWEKGPWSATPLQSVDKTTWQSVDRWHYNTWYENCATGYFLDKDIWAPTFAGMPDYFTTHLTTVWTKPLGLFDNTEIVKTPNTRETNL